MLSKNLMNLNKNKLTFHSVSNVQLEHCNKIKFDDFIIPEVQHLNPKLSFQLVSDLHLEYYDKIHFNDFIIPKASNLIIAGDIGYQHLDNYNTFMESCSESFDKVFMVLGNHDYYNYKSKEILTMEDIETNIKTIIEKYNNIHLLHNDVYEFNDYVILGTVLWSNIPFNMAKYVQNNINDYNYIYDDKLKPITPNKINYLHYKNVEWLEKMIGKYLNKKIIVITHHLPSFKLISPKYYNNLFNCAFATDLEYLMKDNVLYWCCGHTHTSCSTVINNCKLFVNPKGYPINNNQNENQSYDKQFIFNVNE